MNLEQLIISYDDEKKADLFNEIKRRKEYIMERKRTETSGDVVSDTLDIIKDTFNNLRIYISSKTGIDVTNRNTNNSLPDGYWNKVIKNNLDSYKNNSKLENLLKNAGFVSPDTCSEILNSSKRNQCKKTYQNIKQHILLNTKQIILYESEIKEIENRINDLNKLKKDVGFSKRRASTRQTYLL